MKKILIATNNEGKLREFQALLRGFDFITPAQLNIAIEIEEDGTTYAENAAKKARAFTQASGFISLADDSGLEVDALNGAPGLYSKRFGSVNGNNLSDAERRRYLIRMLQDKPPPWTARFRATVAVATPYGNLELAEGICEGEIIPDERGTNGFGYDPIFLLTELGKTMAELSMDEKNRLSHRARAVMNAGKILENVLKD